MARWRAVETVEIGHGDEPRLQTVTGVVVVVDVVRAFTTAAIAAVHGAERFVCVADLDDAVARRAADPAAVLVGEHGGERVAGLDFWNSPGELDRAGPSGLRGRTIVFRTTNGTRVLAAASGATHLLAAATVNVAATAAWIERHAPGMPVTIAATDPRSREDRACAEHLTALLLGDHVDAGRTEKGVRLGVDDHLDRWARAAPAEVLDGFLADAELCAGVDTHPVALVGTRTADGAVLLHPQRAGR